MRYNSATAYASQRRFKLLLGQGNFQNPKDHSVVDPKTIRLPSYFPFGLYGEDVRNDDIQRTPTSVGLRSHWPDDGPERNCNSGCSSRFCIESPNVEPVERWFMRAVR